MVNSGHLANPVSQSLCVASRAMPRWNIQSHVTCGTAMVQNNKNNDN